MKRYSIVLLVSLVLMLPVKGRAQVASMNTLSMLQMSSSARTAALGMPYVSLYDPQDVQLGIDNASLVCEGYHRRVAVDYVGLFGGAGFGSVAVGYKFEKVPGTFLFGAHFNSYGKFEGYDEQDVYQGDFFAADYALSASWGLPIDSNFALGVSMMPILSQYESYTAMAVSANVAANFVSDNRRFSATLAARNIGAQLFQIGALAADQQTRTARLDGDAHIAAVTFDDDSGNSGLTVFLLDEGTDFQVFMQPVAEARLRGIPAGTPVLVQG